MALTNGFIKIKNQSGQFDTLFPITKAENIIVDLGTDKRLPAKLTELDDAIASKISASEKGVANGVATLDANGTVPLAQLPAGVKEVRCVANIAERNAITETFRGLSVFVEDATDDPTVSSGGAFYIFNGTSWIKTAEAESLDVVLQWVNIQNKPTTLSGYGIIDAVNKNELTDTPEAGKVLKVDSDLKLHIDIEGNASTASTLKIGRNIGITGTDVVAADVVFDGSQNINIPVALSETGVEEGTYIKVTVDNKGRVTAGGNLLAADIPSLDWTKITTGKPTTLSGYGITDAINKSGDTMTGYLTLHDDPTQDLHAVTKRYVDAAVQGLDIKASVRVATTTNLEALSGLLVVDGVQLKEGDRVLVKDQINKVNNGIYVASTSAWSRATDFDDIPEIEVDGGEFVFVTEGTVNADMGFVLVSNSPVRIGVDELEFTQFSGAGQVITGIGLSKTGNVINLADTGVIAGIYTKVTVNAQGQVTSGGALTAVDIPELDWSKITTGKPTSSVEDIDDAVLKRHSHANASVLNGLSAADNRLYYEGRGLAFKDEATASALSVTEPEGLPVNGIWFQTV